MATFFDSSSYNSTGKQLSQSEQKQLEDELNAMIDQSTTSIVNVNDDKQQSVDFDFEALFSTPVSTQPSGNFNSMTATMDSEPPVKKRKRSDEGPASIPLLAGIASSKSQSEPPTCVPSPTASEAVSKASPTPAESNSKTIGDKSAPNSNSNSIDPGSKVGSGSGSSSASGSNGKTTEAAAPNVESTTASKEDQNDIQVVSEKLANPSLSTSASASMTESTSTSTSAPSMDTIRQLKKEIISRHTLLTTYSTLKQSFAHVCSQLKESKKHHGEVEGQNKQLRDRVSTLESDNQAKDNRIKELESLLNKQAS